MFRFRSLSLLVSAILLSAVAGAVAAPPPEKKPAFAEYVHDQTNKILDGLESTKDSVAAKSAAADLFDQVALYAPDNQLAAFRDASFCRRLTRQVDQLPADADPIGTLAYLRKNPDLASTLVFLIPQDSKRVGDIYAVLAKLRQKHADQLNRFASLTAALCVVRSQPLVDRVNENKVEADDPVAVWEYYAANERRMFFGLKFVPAELLGYVVDTTASVGDLRWALNKYQGDKVIGQHFFDIKYDYDNARTGATKKVTTAGYTLPNILQFGGVCADQAYFATTIGKAIGVPTAYTVGEAAEVGHAWVGFLASNGRSGAWDFNVGRYEAYQGVRGTVRDPFSRETIPDNYVSLLGQLIGTKPVDRQNCAALTDVATRFRRAVGGQEPFAAAAPEDCAPGTFRATPRSADVATTLNLIELALRQCSGNLATWLEIRDMAVANQLTLKDKQRWADILMRLGAKQYPDFTLEIITPMVKTVSDVKEQDALWRALLPVFKSRFDLSAAIMINEAKMWADANEPVRAGNCYMNVVQSYANSGPFIVDALKGAENLLVSTNHPDRVVQLYAVTWQQIKPPTRFAQMFIRSSSWYRVGEMYADKLKAAGQDMQADQVLAKLKAQGSQAVQ